MATTMYAWTTIKNGNDVVKPGDSVKKGDFSDEDWDQLLDSRAVRSQKFPDMPGDFAGSPREFMIKEVNRQLEEAEGVLSDDDYLAVERTVDSNAEDE